MLYSTPSIVTFAGTTNSVSLNWTASNDNEGVTGYNIYQGNTLVGTTTNTNYTIDGLEDNTTYNFSVEAFDATGNASIKATVTQATVKLPDTTKPTAPSNLTATSSDQSICLNWTASTDNEGVAGYNIYVTS